MAYENIPLELQQRQQWVCWKYEITDNGKQTKRPYNPRTGSLASVTSAATWCSFNEAITAAWNGYSGIGFVFSGFDEYCGIDLDVAATQEEWELHQQIYDNFDSYSELSPSGKGLHIIIKAKLPNGKRSKGAEIYSSDRYFTFTGNVYKQAKPVAERQAMAEKLWMFLGGTNEPTYDKNTVVYNGPRLEENQIIIDRCGAVEKTGQLFRELWAGVFSPRYPSQSEADQSFINLVQYQTKNVEQIMEIFHASALGKRPKAFSKYHNDRMIKNAFDLTPPPIDTTELVASINDAIARNNSPKAAATPEPSVDIDFWRKSNPPGIMGEVLQYIYDQSPRPIRDVSLVAAMGLFAGICGRCYNVSNTGLNIYLMLLAPTGSGKEAMRTGINSLMHSVAHQVMPAALDFLGPSDMASGAGLLKHLADPGRSPSYVSLTGEVGLRMQQLSASTANQADITLRKVLLDLYPASKKGGMIRPTVYSDKKNNIEIIYSPNFTWLGESTGSEFYKALSEEHIASGLLPRFTIVEYTGPRVEDNEQHAFAQPSSQLIDNMRKLCETSLKLNQSGTVVDVAFTPEARAVRKEYNRMCDAHMDATSSEPLKQLWNRADLKAMKVAALIAISVNMHEPVIDAHIMRWAISFIHCDVFHMTQRFESGEIGVSAFHEGFRRLSSRMITHMEGRSKPSNYTEYDYMKQACVSRGLLMQITNNVSVFKNNYRLLSEILVELDKLGVLVKLDKIEARTKFGVNTRAELYHVMDAQWFYNHADT